MVATFFGHTIRDEADLNWHLDDIHFNPVKHGLAQRFSDWLWSSFHRYVRKGFYDRKWGEGLGNDLSEMRCGE